MEGFDSTSNIKSLALQRLLSNMHPSFIKDQRIKERLIDPNLNTDQIEELRNEISKENPWAAPLLDQAVDSLMEIFGFEIQQNINKLTIPIKDSIQEKVVELPFKNSKNIPKRTISVPDPIYFVQPVENVQRNIKKKENQSTLRFALTIGLILTLINLIPPKSQTFNHNNCQDFKIEIPKNIAGY